MMKLICYLDRQTDRQRDSSHKLLNVNQLVQEIKEGHWRYKHHQVMEARTDQRTPWQFGNDDKVWQLTAKVTPLNREAFCPFSLCHGSEFHQGHRYSLTAHCPKHRHCGFLRRPIMPLPLNIDAKCLCLTIAIGIGTTWILIRLSNHRIYTLKCHVTWPDVFHFWIVTLHATAASVDKRDSLRIFKLINGGATSST
jgi:hypothetical protein